MDFLFDAIANVLAYCYDLTNNFGLAIMLLTLAVMVVVTPLTLKSTRSMIAMQQLQPELRKLQAKYKDDRQKLNEEMMAFYKEHNINPLFGCLPLVVQIPVFIVLYRVLLGLAKLPCYGDDMGRAAGLFARNPGGDGVYQGFGTFDPGYLSRDTGLYQALDSVREMNSFCLDLADSVTNKLSEGIGAALPYLILVGLIGLTAWYQQKQIQARNSDNQAAVNPQQQMLMKVMPFFLPLISLTLPAGIVLYFLVSNSYRIAQQAFITRTMYSDKAKAKAGGGGGGSAPSRSETLPSGSKGLLGGLIQLPGRGDGNGDGADDEPKQAAGGKAKAPSGSKGSSSAWSKGSSGSKGSSKSAGKGSGSKANGSSNAKGSGAKASGSNGSGTKAPARKAPARKAPAAPSNQNRSKKKRKRN
ncbi:hypothetical protein BH24ACT4_BH24ACT4_01360 [soil metagenome]